MTSSSDETAQPEESDTAANDSGEANANETSESSASEDPKAADETTEESATDSPNDEAADSESSDSGEKSEEDLPDWEPLTPELVEDEAIRGDFMLRWATILLAFLLGCTVISESETLVKIKTGQYLAANGWLPPANDVFSSTASDRAWTNLSWLYDLVIAGVYSIGGEISLSLFTALLAGITWYLIASTSIPGVSTWWGSIVATLALIVCYPQFTARPELITLLGLALVFWILRGWKDRESPKSLWGLVVVFLVWSNMDPRMFLGLAAITLYAGGEATGNLVGRSGFADPAKRKHLWIVVGCCFAASLVNPFTIQSLTAMPTLYGVEYPSLRAYNPIALGSDQPPIERLQYYPMMSGLYWKWITQHSASGIFVLLASLIACVLNRAKLDFGNVFLLGGFLGFALVGSHELAAAAVVCCIVATINIQQWYRDNFRQSYSVEMNELIFSRGGRAVTVLAMFVLAFLAVTGRMMGPSGNRIGVGFSDDLRASYEGLQSSLEDSFDDQPFNFRLSQGDHLIWIGKKPFVDSRVAIYHSTGEDNILNLHDDIRYALLRRQPNATDDRTARPDIWKPGFNKYNITHVVPRLSGVAPDYNTYFDLLTSGNWQLTSLGSVTAVFYRRDSGDPALNAFLRKNEFNFITLAFREEVDSPEARVEWAKAKTAYDNFFDTGSVVVSNPVQRARHYTRHLPLIRDQRTQAAIAYLIIRNVNKGLGNDEYSAEAFQMLGEAYAYLRSLEIQLCQFSGFEYYNELRYLQSVIAFNQSLTLNPNNPAIHELLVDAHLSANKLDLALQSLHRIEDLSGDLSELTEQQMERKNRYDQLEEQISGQEEQIIIAVDQALEEEDAKVFEIADQVHRQGFVLQALRILEDHQVKIVDNPAAQQLRAVLLLQVGRMDEAATILGQLQSMDKRYTAGVNWQDPMATLAIASADYKSAVGLHTDRIRTNESQQVGQMLTSMPMGQTPIPFFSPSDENWPIERGILWPVPQCDQAAKILYNSTNRLVVHHLHVALCNLESGKIKESTKAFNAILETNPETPYRPLISFYLYQIENKVIDMEPPSDWIPNTPDIFADEESAAE